MLGCSDIDKSDLTIIDNIQLGQNIKDFYLSADNLGIKKDSFLTQYYYTEKDLREKQMTIFYYSEVFNLTRAKGLPDHYGLYYHTTASGTENVVGLTLLLGHTTTPTLITEKYEMINMTEAYKKKGFYQEVHESLINEYISMFTTKYGPPLTHENIAHNNFYVIENNNIEKYSTPDDDDGRYFTWETDNIKISFFTGIKSYRTYYLKKPQLYSYATNQSTLQKINQYREQCYSFPYINYELKPTVVEKLKLNKPKI